MSLISRKIAAFAKKVANLPPKPGGTMPVADLQAQFDAAPEELRAALNGAIDDVIADYATKSELNGLVLGQVPNGSIPEPKLETSLAQKVNGGLVDFLSRQAIINGNFDIWQRGVSLSAGAGGYLADRWISTGNGGTTVAPSRQSFIPGQADVPNEPKFFHRAIVVSGGASGSYSSFEQKLEGVHSFAGQTITISFWAKSDSNRNITLDLYQFFGYGGAPSDPVSGIGVENFALTTSWNKFTKTINIPSIEGKVIGTSGDALSVTFWLEAGSNFDSRTNSLGNQSGTFDFAQVQLNAGDIGLPFQPRSFAEELALCQRYYEKSYDYGTAPGTVTSNGAEIVMAVTPNNLSKQDTRFRTKKRVVPTVKVYSSQNGTVGYTSEYNDAGTFSNDRSVATSMVSESSYVVKPNGSTFGTNSWQRWHWTADAEL